MEISRCALATGTNQIVIIALKGAEDSSAAFGAHPFFCEAPVVGTTG